MNKERRKAIDALITEIRSLENEMTCLVQQVGSAVEAILGDEQDAFDNMPESLQYAEKGEAAQEAINALEYADGEMGAGCLKSLTRLTKSSAIWRKQKHD